MTHPGLSRDTATWFAPGPGADSEGNPTMVLTNKGSVKGTYGTPMTADLEIARRNGYQVDAVFATQAALMVDDLLDLRSHRWRVVALEDVRFHTRAKLRRVD